MKSALTMGWRVVTFAVVPALSILASFTLLPLISARYGPDGWSALTVGQSVGALISVFAGLAWAVTGGYRVAREPDAGERVRIFIVSTVSRSITLVFTLVPGVVIVVAVVHTHTLEAVGFCIGVGLNALSAGWYWAGVSNGVPLILTEGLVRLAAYGVALAGMAVLHLGLLWYATAVIAGGLTSATLNWRLITSGSGARLSRQHLRAGVHEMRDQGLGTVSRTLQAGFSYGGPAIFAFIAPESLAAYSAFDQVRQSFANASGAVINGFTGWVGSGGDDRRRRSFIALLLCVSGAVAFMLAFGFGGEELLRFIFAGRAHLPPLIIWLLAVAVSSVFLVRAVEQLGLVPAGRARVVYWGNLIGAVGGLGVLVAGALLEGVAGAASGVISAALISAAWYLLLAAKERRAARSTIHGQACRREEQSGESRATS